MFMMCTLYVDVLIKENMNISIKIRILRKTIPFSFLAKFMMCILYVYVLLKENMNNSIKIRIIRKPFIFGNVYDVYIIHVLIKENMNNSIKIRILRKTIHFWQCLWCVYYTYIYVLFKE